MTSEKCVQIEEIKQPTLEQLLRLNEIGLEALGNFSAESEFEKPWVHFWIARTDAIVGFLVAWHVADELHILHTAVAHDSRRQGIGRALMQHAFAYSKNNALSVMCLEVRSGNVAGRALYETFGFQEVRTRPRYYPDGEDAIEMMRNVAVGLG